MYRAIILRIFVTIVIFQGFLISKNTQADVGNRTTSVSSECTASLASLLGGSLPTCLDNIETLIRDRRLGEASQLLALLLSYSEINGEDRDRLVLYAAAADPKNEFHGINQKEIDRLGTVGFQNRPYLRIAAAHYALLNHKSTQLAEALVRGWEQLPVDGSKTFYNPAQDLTIVALQADARNSPELLQRLIDRLNALGHLDEIAAASARNKLALRLLATKSYSDIGEVETLLISSNADMEQILAGEEFYDFDDDQKASVIDTYAETLTRRADVASVRANWHDFELFVRKALAVIGNNSGSDYDWFRSELLFRLYSLAKIRSDWDASEAVLRELLSLPPTANNHNLQNALLEVDELRGSKNDLRASLEAYLKYDVSAATAGRNVKLIPTLMSAGDHEKVEYAITRAQQSLSLYATDPFQIHDVAENLVDVKLAKLQQIFQAQINNRPISESLIQWSPQTQGDAKRNKLMLWLGSVFYELREYVLASKSLNAITSDVHSSDILDSIEVAILRSAISLKQQNYSDAYSYASEANTLATQGNLDYGAPLWSRIQDLFLALAIEQRDDKWIEALDSYSLNWELAQNSPNGDRVVSTATRLSQRPLAKHEAFRIEGEVATWYYLFSSHDLSKSRGLIESHLEQLHKLNILSLDPMYTSADRDRARVKLSADGTTMDQGIALRDIEHFQDAIDQSVAFDSRPDRKRESDFGLIRNRLEEVLSHEMQASPVEQKKTGWVEDRHTHSLNAMVSRYVRIAHSLARLGDGDASLKILAALPENAMKLTPGNEALLAQSRLLSSSLSEETKIDLCRSLKADPSKEMYDEVEFIRLMATCADEAIDRGAGDLWFTIAQALNCNTLRRVSLSAEGRSLLTSLFHKADDAGQVDLTSKLGRAVIAGSLMAGDDFKRIENAITIVSNVYYGGPIPSTMEARWKHFNITRTGTGARAAELAAVILASAKEINDAILRRANTDLVLQPHIDNLVSHLRDLEVAGMDVDAVEEIIEELDHTAGLLYRTQRVKSSIQIARLGVETFLPNAYSVDLSKYADFDLVNTYAYVLHQVGRDEIAVKGFLELLRRAPPSQDGTYFDELVDGAGQVLPFVSAPIGHQLMQSIEEIGRKLKKGDQNGSAKLVGYWRAYDGVLPVALERIKSLSPPTSGDEFSQKVWDAEIDAIKARIRAQATNAIAAGRLREALNNLLALENVRPTIDPDHESVDSAFDSLKTTLEICIDGAPSEARLNALLAASDALLGEIDKWTSLQQSDGKTVDKIEMLGQRWSTLQDDLLAVAVAIARGGRKEQASALVESLVEQSHRLGAMKAKLSGLSKQQVDYLGRDAVGRIALVRPMFLVLSGKTSEAEDAYWQWFDIDRDLRGYLGQNEPYKVDEANVSLGRILIASGRSKEAKRKLESALSRIVANANETVLVDQIHLLLAEIATQDGNVDEAIEHLDKIELTPFRGIDANDLLGRPAWESRIVGDSVAEGLYLHLIDPLVHLKFSKRVNLMRIRVLAMKARSTGGLVEGRGADETIRAGVLLSRTQTGDAFTVGSLLDRARALGVEREFSKLATRLIGDNSRLLTDNSDSESTSVNYLNPCLATSMAVSSQAADRNSLVALLMAPVPFYAASTDIVPYGDTPQATADLARARNVLREKAPDLLSGLNELLAVSAPPSAATIQARLKPSEAIVMPIFIRDYAYSIVVTSQEVSIEGTVIGSADVSTEDIVAKLRNSLIPRDDGTLPIVNLRKAAEISQMVFGSYQRRFLGISRIYFVPVGALQSIPPSVLLADWDIAKELAESGDPDYRTVPWLDSKFSVVTLPGLSMFTSASVSTENWPNSILAIGDPELNGDPTCANTVEPLLDEGGNLVPERLRRSFCRDGFTGDVVDALARQFGIDRSDPRWSRQVALGARATEATLRDWGRDAKLSAPRILLIATHGLLAEETLKMSGLSQPSLIFTPPSGDVHSEDDGLLFASDVPMLGLRPQWVVLTACNSASTDGTSGGEGLSGLVKAFMLGGAQGVLATHWAVNARTIADFTTDLLDEFAHNGSDMDVAMQKTMYGWRNSSARPRKFQHPYYWAPYVVTSTLGLN